MNRAPSVVWSLRGPDKYPYYQVRTTDDDRIEIGAASGNGYMDYLLLSRKDARLLAKRINQCLDDTRK